MDGPHANHPLSGPSSGRYQVLLEVAEAIASHRDLAELFHELSVRLHGVVQFDYLNLILHDPARKVMRLHILETSRPTQLQAGFEIPEHESAAGHVFETQQPMIVPDIEKETRFPLMHEILRQEQIASFCILPLSTAQRRLGALSFGRAERHQYSPDEVEFMQQVARQVAVAVDNALNYDRAQRYQQQLASERDRLRVLLEINNALISNLELKELFNAIADSLRRVIHHDYTSLALYDDKRKVMRVQALDFPQGRGLIHEELEAPVPDSPAGICYTNRKAMLLRAQDLSTYNTRVSQLLLAEGVRTLCCVPLITRDRVLGTINVASLRDAAFTQQDLDLLTQVAAQVAIAVENALAYRQIAELKNKLAEEKLYLEDEIRTEMNFEEIVGESARLKTILKQVETVAPT
ncbi:MAG: GAF domain-containing protein, partial [Bryobacteraceae bacterium]